MLLFDKRPSCFNDVLTSSICFAPRVYNVVLLIRFSLHWIPPEHHKKPEDAKKHTSADMWALGTTLWQLFSSGKEPFVPEAVEQVSKHFRVLLVGTTYLSPSDDVLVLDRVLTTVRTSSVVIYTMHLVVIYFT